MELLLMYSMNELSRLLIAFSLSLALLLNSACATMDKNDCLNTDWHVHGYKDGLSGNIKSNLDSHQQACAKFGINLDSVAYNKGRLEGIRELCCPDGRRDAETGLDLLRFQGRPPANERR